MKRQSLPGLIPLLSLSMSVQVRSSDAGVRICVVAFHDSSTFTVCYPVSRSSRINDDKLVAIPGAGNSLPVPPDRPDLDLKESIERELKKDKQHVVVGSPETADLIFLVEGIYVSIQTTKVRFQTLVDFRAGKGGGGREYLQAAMAIVVPSQTYLANPNNVRELIDARLWEGAVAWQPGVVVSDPSAYVNAKSASIVGLVEQFLKKKRPAGMLPLCGGWFPPDGLKTNADMQPANALPGRGQIELVVPEIKERSAAGRNSNASVSAPGQHRQPETGQIIRVEVDMVSLPVVVTTREGKRVTDLQERDFQVFEDGVAQAIAGFAATDEVISLLLALDTSSSTQRELARIQSEAVRFVNILPLAGQVALMSFSGQVYLLGQFSDDREGCASQIMNLRSGGWTALYDAVWLGLDRILRPVKTRSALLLFTDGVDTHSMTKMNDSLELAKETGAAIYCIYFNTQPTDSPQPMRSAGIHIGGDYKAGRKYLKELTESTGGLVYDALKIGDLGPAFEQIAKDLMSQYSIGYYSTNPRRHGKFRKVKVKVNKPGLVARTRSGYYVGKDSN